MRDANTITNELIASGLAPAQTALLMELVLSMSTGTGGANRAIENRRAWDRTRKKRKRDADRLSTNSTGLPPASTGNPVENADVCPTVDNKKTGLSVKKENKKGSRLLSGTRASNEQKLIAIECGCPPERVDAVWTEFVDYWSDIPGWKGCKLNWTGTWRNRVKQVFGTGFGNGQNHGKTKRTIIQAASDLSRKVASFDGPAGFDLRDAESPPPPRLLSNG